MRFEPRDTTETPGLLLCAAAGFALALIVTASRRISRSVRATRRCARLLESAGTRVVSEDGTTFWRIESEYPVAAVTGVFRSRLLLSTRILNECTPDEIDTIISHERAHVRRRDNLVRAAMLCLPDPLRLTRVGREMEAAWADAAEEAADEAAAGAADERRALLAAALVRVARMANTPMPDWMPGLAFYEGNNLETRVRRLLGAARLSTRTRLHALAAFGIVSTVFGLAVTETASRELHTWMELAVQYVP
jgi:beta-lactamase regulating signal transducer with metallopeptidase domain